MKPSLVIIVGSILISGCGKPNETPARIPRNDPIERLVIQLKNDQHEERGSWLPNGPSGLIPLPPTAPVAALVSQALAMVWLQNTNITILATRKVRIADVRVADMALNWDYTAVLVAVGMKTNIVLLQPYEDSAGWWYRVYRLEGPRWVVEVGLSPEAMQNHAMRLLDSTTPGERETGAILCGQLRLREAIPRLQALLADPEYSSQKSGNGPWRNVFYVRKASKEALESMGQVTHDVTVEVVTKECDLTLRNAGLGSAREVKCPRQSPVSF